MNKLFDGVVKFQQEDFETHKELFTNLKESQEPHTLFIGCVDSRLVPSLITKTLPGELFIVRNIANIVPPYRVKDEFLSTTAAIEYALKKLNIENIVVCGHSNCGGCMALYEPEEAMKDIPNVKKWIELFEDVKEEVEKTVDINDLKAREWMTEQANVVKQLKHLFTYPFIRERYNEGTLNIYGWHYIIETGEVFSLNTETMTFELINGEELRES